MKTNKGNKLWQAFWLTFLVVASLIGLFYLPRTSFLGTDLRRINLLSDVQRRDKEGQIIAEIKADSADGFVEQKLDSAAISVQPVAYADTVPPGMVPIEDFADPNGLHREMDNFYAALDLSRQRPVRVAYFGDSYIEGDILTRDLRAMLQKRYGGHGVGFVEIACVSSGFRQSVVTGRNGWNNYHANEPGRGFRANLQGLAGSYFIPNAKASFEIRGTKKVYANLLDTVEVATVYFTPGNGLNISYACNGGETSVLYSNGTPQIPETYEEVVTISANNADETTADADTSGIALHQSNDTSTRKIVVQRTVPVAQPGSGNIVSRSVNEKMGRFSLRVAGGQGSRFYGVALDSPYGVALDNYSMRGSGGQHLSQIPSETLRAFADARPYDLIVIHFGLNVANAKQKDYSAYVKQLGQTIDHLKTAYPNASLLVVSMGDRDKRGVDGKMHTMSGVAEMVAFLRKMASDHHVAFWNLYEAMGGDGSLARMVENKQANLDYTHINFAGGKHLAKLLFDVLMNGKENYDNRAH